MSNPDLRGSFIDERCPKCGATLLGNKIGNKWCSNIGGAGMRACDFGLKVETKTKVNEIEQIESSLYLNCSDMNWVVNNINYLISTVKSLQKDLKTCKGSWEEKNEEVRSLRHTLSLANEKNGGDYYTWQPFEENHLETLSCPVLIEADWIRQLISFETESLQKENKRLSVIEKMFENGIVHYTPVLTVIQEGDMGNA